MGLWRGRSLAMVSALPLTWDGPGDGGGVFTRPRDCLASSSASALNRAQRGTPLTLDPVSARNIQWRNKRVIKRVP